MINTAREMNIGTIVIDGNCEAPGLKVADKSKNIDFSNLTVVYKYINSLLDKDINVCGVSTMGSDVPHLLAAISDKYNWNGPSIETGRLTTNKYYMKQKLSQNGIPVPRFALINRFEEIDKYWEQWKCNMLVIKPTDRAGSRGVRLLNKKENIKRDYNYALSNSNIDEVMIEEYIEGHQISTETILYDDFCSTPGFADRVYQNMESFYPQIMENGGWVPSNHSKSDIKNVKELVERASRALGIKRGVAKGDVVLHQQNGPMIIEIAARLSGGDFCESLVPLSSGINYVSDVIRMAIGKKPDYDILATKSSKNTVANRYFFLPPGPLEEIVGIESINQLPEVQKIDLYYEPGDTIVKIDAHGQRAGVFVIVSKNRASTQELIDYVYENVKFRIDDKWHIGNPKYYVA